MDNLIQKFYSNGKEEEQKYTQFGAFSNTLMKNPGTKFNFIKPNISVVNPAIHNVETKTHISIPKTPNKDIISNNTYLNPKKIIFNSSSDLFNQNIPKNNFAYSTKNENGLNKEPIPSLKTIKDNINTENKKNSTKMQMMEEKMKNLELKRQKGIKEEKEKKEKEKEEDENENEISEKSKRIYEKKRKRKNKKRNKEIMINNQQEEEELMNQFKERTDEISRKYLNNIKTDLGLALVEKQLQKNELLNDITEDILDLKGDLMNKLNRLEMKQKAEIKKIAYCLQNSGDEKVENLATRLFGDDLLKPEEEILNFNSDANSMRSTTLKFTGSVFNTNLFKTNITKNKRRSSIDEGNKPRRKSTMLNSARDVIIEEKED